MCSMDSNASESFEGAGSFDSDSNPFLGPPPGYLENPKSNAVPEPAKPPKGTALRSDSTCVPWKQGQLPRAVTLRRTSDSYMGSPLRRSFTAVHDAAGAPNGVTRRVSSTRYSHSFAGDQPLSGFKSLEGSRQGCSVNKADARFPPLEAYLFPSQDKSSLT